MALDVDLVAVEYFHGRLQVHLCKPLCWDADTGVDTRDNSFPVRITLGYIPFVAGVTGDELAVFVAAPYAV
jgi:hypothetical protein